MELYEEILLTYLQKNRISPNCIEKIVHDMAYQTIQKIKLVLEDDELDDQECFWRIEKIVGIFEEIGSGAGNRHDFG